MIATKNDFDAPTKGVTAGYIAGLVGCLAAAGAFIATTFYLKLHHAAPAAFMGAALVYGLVVVAITTYTGGLSRRIGKTGASAAARRYRRRFTTAMVVYVVALVGALSGVTQYHITGPAAYVLAIAPALPLLAVIVIMGLYLREETDEFERSIQAEAALWASGGMLAVATVWGFLELFELVPHIQTWWAFPIWAFLLGPGQAIARRRYR